MKSKFDSKQNKTKPLENPQLKKKKKKSQPGPVGEHPGSESELSSESCLGPCSLHRAEGGAQPGMA